ncbi:MAG: glycosyltransferase family 4 protein [Candidatus Nanohalobium sp.]
MDEKLVVCHFTPLLSLVDGGIERSVLQQRKALEDRSVEVVESPFHGFDVLHLNYFDPVSILVFSWAYLSGRDIVVHAHTTAEDFRDSVRFSNFLAPLVDVFTGFFYRRADRVVAPSQYTRGLLEDKGVGSVKVVSNGIDTDRLEGCSTVEKGEGFDVVNLGFVFERKGLSDFVSVAEEMPEAEFHWFGPRVEGFMSSNRVEEAIQDSPDNAEFPGFIDNVNDAFELADVFFLPTREENQGMSVLEAAYVGVPVVIRDIPVFEQWFEDGVHCLKADSVEGFVEALQILREDRDLRQRLVRNAREVAEQHTLDEVGKSLEKVYTSLQ